MNVIGVNRHVSCALVGSHPSIDLIMLFEATDLSPYHSGDITLLKKSWLYLNWVLITTRLGFSKLCAEGETKKTSGPGYPNSHVWNPQALNVQAGKLVSDYRRPYRHRGENAEREESSCCGEGTAKEGFPLTASTPESCCRIGQGSFLTSWLEPQRVLCWGICGEHLR